MTIISSDAQSLFADKATESTNFAYITTIVGTMNMPETTQISTKFVYNYHMPDETTNWSGIEVENPSDLAASTGRTHVSSVSRRSYDSSSTTSQLAGYYSTQSLRFPRYIELAFDQVSMDNPSPPEATLDEIYLNLESYISLAAKEESMSNTAYSGINVQLTDAYSKFSELYTNSDVQSILATFNFLDGVDSAGAGSTLHGGTVPGSAWSLSMNDAGDTTTVTDGSFTSAGQGFTLGALDTVEETGTPYDAASQLLSEISDFSTDVITGMDSDVKSSLYDVMTNYQQYGYSHVQESEDGTAITVSLNDIESSFTDMDNITFGSSINNYLLYSLSKGAGENFASTFSSTFLSQESVTLSATNSFQSLGATTGDIDLSDFFPVVNPVSILIDEIDGTPSVESSDDSLIPMAVVGYLIEKVSLSPSGTESSSSFVSAYPDGNNVIDSAIAYGYGYQYSVRTIVYAEIPVINRSLLSSDEDQYARAGVLLLSRKGPASAVRAIDTSPPPAPVNLDFFYNYGQDTLTITWEHPTNPQDDIKYYQLFRREITDDPFEMLVMYDFDNSEVKWDSGEEGLSPNLIQSYYDSSYEDTDFDKDSTYIYSVCSLDARKMTSGYSAQFEVSFNRLTNSLIVKYLSKSGAPKPYPNLYLQDDTFVDTIKTEGYSDIKIYFDPEYYLVSSAADGPILNYLSVSAKRPVYKFNIINTDMQQSKMVDINIVNVTDEAENDWSEYVGLSVTELEALSSIWTS